MPSSLGYTNPYLAEDSGTLPIEVTIPARAGLLGNPSDGYHGKTISVVLDRFHASVRLAESDCLDIRHADRTEFTAANVRELTTITSERGYQGASKLLQATVAHFCERCRIKSIDIRPATFALEYDSDVPLGVGLAGSSALIIATLRCLTRHFGVQLAPYALAEMALDIETRELGITAGLQDRVIQAYGGCLFMDFHRELVQFRGYGRYERIELEKLPPLFVAYQPALAEESGKVHNDLKQRWLNDESDVRATMGEIAELAGTGYELLEKGRGAELGPLLDRNFDLRTALYDVGDGNRNLVQSAREAGAHAKLAGSGGAIVGVAQDGGSVEAIVDALKGTSEAFAVTFQ